ncbi:uncharacterized protein BX663DRAFT_548887 [Cokeromyces recurvatus]|uniref:uncharacterized protein n=1 Tax=Cokeromyces recurvatus TaxID=90255 RepID=UPI0022206C2A|nr:uncharacterized protein BX663DRAFT_548887 [Cokeromyces recurvatus]KAI7906736.1 hypothetical protein BX663DRAFT_548887 [Cokeromyces recurvatus]
MAKKSSNEGRRESSVSDNITIVNETNYNNSKFTIIQSTNQDAIPTKEIKTWEELKEECTTLDEIRLIIRRLPLDNVLPLLQELLTKFNVQQTHDAALTEWIKILLLTHTAYFMSLPDIVRQLSKIYKQLDNRLTVYPKLLAMRGRLDLIQNQIDARNRKDDSEDEVSDIAEEAYSESEDDIDDEDDDIEDEDNYEDNDDGLMELDNNETEMFKEEEEDMNTEDEDDNISDSDIEE